MSAPASGATRRTLLALLPAVALPASATLAAPTPHPDADLLAACAMFTELERQRLRHYATSGDDDPPDSVLEPIEALQRANVHVICSTRAKTPDGVRAKLQTFISENPDWMQSLVGCVDDFHGYYDERLLGTVLRELVESLGLA